MRETSYSIFLIQWAVRLPEGGPRGWKNTKVKIGMALRPDSVIFTPMTASYKYPLRLLSTTAYPLAYMWTPSIVYASFKFPSASISPSLTLMNS